MKKFFVPALALILLALTLTACGLATSSEGTACAAGNEFYVYIAPTDEELISDSFSSASDVAVHSESSGELFLLQKSYYYKVTRYNSVYVLSLDGVFDCYMQDLPSTLLVTSLPGGVTEADAVPSVTLTLKEGEEVFLNNSRVPITKEDGLTLTFLGTAADDPTKVVFCAPDADANILYGVAEADKFESFSVPWHPLAEARRAELTAPEEPEQGDDGAADGDLTGGEPSDALRIILIIGIAVPALIIVFLLFKPVAGGKRGYDKRKTMRRQDPEGGGIDYDRTRSYESDRDRYDRGYRDYERERPRDYYDRAPRGDRDGYDRY